MLSAHDSDAIIGLFYSRILIITAPNTRFAMKMHSLNATNELQSQQGALEKVDSESKSFSSHYPKLIEDRSADAHPHLERLRIQAI